MRPISHSLIPAGVLVTLSTLITAIPVTTVATEHNKPILGIIDFGKTTVKEVVQAVKEKGCQVSTHDNVAKISGNCFNLPGEKGVDVVGYGAAGPIAMIDIHYDTSMEGHEFDKYLKGLKKSYGKPNKLQNPYVGNRTAIWKKSNVVIVVEEPHMSFEADVYYMTPEVYARIIKDSSKEKKAKEKALEQL